MSKRKRAASGKSTTGQEETPAAGAGVPEDAAMEDVAKDDMVHVSADLLADSPDVFAAQPSEAAAAVAPAPAEDQPLEAVSEPAQDETPVAMLTEPTSPAPPAPAEAPPAFVPAPAPASPPVPPPARRTPGGTTLALGVVLVVVGIFALAVVVSGVDLTQYGWPLFVIIPGLTLLVVGFVGGGAGASIPGGLVTMLGLVLAYQSSSGDWPSWAFTWPLVAPFGVGLGMYLQALRDRDTMALRRGRTLMLIGFLISIIGFVFFESILGISGMDYGLFGKAALPLLLIVIGIVLLARNARRSRKA